MNRSNCKNCKENISIIIIRILQSNVNGFERVCTSQQDYIHNSRKEIDR